MVLDGLRDAISGMTESIESSQAVIASYQGLIVEEAHGVEICRRSETVTPSDDDAGDSEAGYTTISSDSDVEVLTDPIPLALQHPADCSSTAGDSTPLLCAPARDVEARTDGSPPQFQALTHRQLALSLTINEHTTPAHVADSNSDTDSPISSTGLGSTSSAESDPEDEINIGHDSDSSDTSSDISMMVHSPNLERDVSPISSDGLTNTSDEEV